MTTVGYGDVVPQTAAGKMVSAILILLGYSLIIVPTGFVSAELVGSQLRREVTTQSCPHCMAEGHDDDAVYCKYCGDRL
jgi:voltage-gated potassium channel